MLLKLKVGSQMIIIRLVELVEEAVDCFVNTVGVAMCFLAFNTVLCCSQEKGGFGQYSDMYRRIAVLSWSMSSLRVDMTIEGSMR